MSILDRVKGTLGFQDDDWEEEFDEQYDHNNKSDLVVHKRGERKKSEWEDEQEDAYYDEADAEYEEEETFEDAPIEEDRSTNVRLTTKPGYGGYRSEDRPRERVQINARGSDTSSMLEVKPVSERREDPRPRSSGTGAVSTRSTNRVSLGTVTGREVTSGMEQSRARQSEAAMHVAEPRSFADAEIFGNRFKNGQPILLDMRKLQNDIAKRLLDFSFGLTFAREGTIDKISDKVFALIPRGARLSADDKKRIEDMNLPDKHARGR